MSEALEGFLLTRQWRDTPNGLGLSFWLCSDQGPARIVIDNERAVCFIDRQSVLPVGLAPQSAAQALVSERREVDLCTLSGQPVDALYFRHQRDLRDAREMCARQAVVLHEADLKPSDRFLMERFITGGVLVEGHVAQRHGYVEISKPRLRRSDYKPSFNWISLDIETDGLDGPILSLALTNDVISQAFIVSPEPVQCADIADIKVQSCADEGGLLDAFFAWLHQHDPDLIIGWNLTNFDLDYLEKRCKQHGRRFDMGRAGEGATILASSANDGPKVARLPGRVALDGIELLKAAFWNFESFELEYVAQQLLGRGKHIRQDGAAKVDAIRALYQNNKPALIEYNIEDCKLVAEIFKRADLISFALRRAELTGLALDRFGGSVAAFDNLYLPRLHRSGRVAPSLVDIARGGSSPGGYVLDSRPGLYDNVLVLDFKSLYPSIIRTFKIDPYGLAVPGDNPIPGFKGASFAREQAILPELIESLWAERDAAKARRDGAMSQAVKILMNSFYGVLGASGCRFHDERLASSITLRGHEIINRSRDLIESMGYQVIYGDTDSLFVLLGSAVDSTQANQSGQQIAAKLNCWWRDTLKDELELESHLEIEFETHFIRFLMPTVRGEQTGSKKRYAGFVQTANGPQLVVKGLESVRTDWTPLARRFQRELFRKVFSNEAFEDYIQALVEDLKAGKLDEELIYQKRLRRRVNEYTRNIPPHVQAAKKLNRDIRWIRYVITSNGPEPVEEHKPIAQPDYEHYLDRQLAPAADGILNFLDTSFNQITNAQMSMF